METTLQVYTVKQICEGFTYSETDNKGLYGLCKLGEKQDSVTNGLTSKALTNERGRRSC